MKRKQVDGNHIIYGEWDAEGSEQFMVAYHPNGLHCTVFLCGGMDYGGGIEAIISDVSSKEVDAIINEVKYSYQARIVFEERFSDKEHRV